MPEPIDYWKALLEDLWIAVGLAVLVALLVIAAWGWVCWPKRVAAQLALDPKAHADVEDNFRKTVGQAFGGIVVLLGAGFAYLQFLQQQRAARDLLISNQVSKGFEQLGSEKIVIRLGGIYALEGVMNGSDQYHQPVLEALSAFVREGKPPPPPPELRPPTQGPLTDVQAALTVIGRRSAGPGAIDLTDAKIPGANLIHANLTGASLAYALMTGADLHGADLRDADLLSADLMGANLINANLTGARLIGAQLGGAQLIQAILRHANLNGANLTGANLSKADLTNVDLRDARIDQKQLDEACGSDAMLLAGLTLKPCPSQSPP
jgi:Pentapeptide repeats (8 copies)